MKELNFSTKVRCLKYLNLYLINESRTFKDERIKVLVNIVSFFKTSFDTEDEHGEYFHYECFDGSDAKTVR